MSRPLLPLLQAFVVAAILAGNAAAYGLTERLGAHPFWAGQVIWIGLAAGLLIGAQVRRWPRRMLALAVLCAGLGGAGAWYGKQVFVASYAENALAGRFWHYGWMVLCAGATALIVLAVLRYTGPRTRA